LLSSFPPFALSKSKGHDYFALKIACSPPRCPDRERVKKDFSPDGGEGKQELPGEGRRRAGAVDHPRVLIYTDCQYLL